MFSYALRIRPRLSEWRGWFPLAILLAAMASVFALGGDRGYFYRGDVHGEASVRTLAIAELLSPAHGFRLARSVWRDEDGGFEYDPYSRFPIGGYALIKLATLPFGSDLAAKLLAARVLMMAMFCGAALFAYLAVVQVAGGRWAALAAVSLAFSGLYALHYADAVFNEGVMDLFGAALAFHGMVEFARGGRFRQLALKTCAALLLGWHVYALILPFAVLGFVGEAAAAARRAASSDGGAIAAARAAGGAFVRSRYVALSGGAILFGGALLAFNLAGEFSAYDGNKALSKLPTVRSMTDRFGHTGTYIGADGTEWDGFLRQQFYRVGVMSAPYAVVRAVGGDFRIPEFAPPLAPTLWGAAATGAALAGLAAFRGRYLIPMASIILFGFCWALPMRYNTYYPLHAHEGIPYIGVALVLFSAALIAVRRALGGRIGGAAVAGTGALAALVFALSVLLAGQTGRDADQAEREKTMFADFNAIADIIEGKRVLLVSSPPEWGDDRGFRRHPPYYYLSGSYWRTAYGCANVTPGAADFAISRHRHEDLDLLTPENRVAFLYGAPNPLELCRAERRLLESSEPAARSEFDVYFQANANALRYLKAPCAPEDYEAPFFVYAYPENANDLPDEFRDSGFQGFSPAIFDEVKVFDGACLMTLYLPYDPIPYYPISAIETGQYISGGGRVWEVAITPPPSAARVALYEKIYQATASGEPAARAGFDLYLDGDALTYLKEPCSEDDTRGRFFLSVHPSDLDDLPAERREIGHESLNFDFAPPAGVIFNGKCMITRQLPSYAIERIQTGQDAPGGARLWSADVSTDD